MPIIDIQRAEPGVVLAADVKDRRGNILLRAGAELTEPHLRSLSMWGVRTLDIEAEEDARDPLADLDPDVLAEAEAEVAERFRPVEFNDHPFLDALLQCAVEQWIRTRGGSHALV
jgi:hypothetical protein